MYLRIFKHANSNHIVTMSFIWMKFADDNVLNILYREVNIREWFVCRLRKEWL